MPTAEFPVRYFPGPGDDYSSVNLHASRIEGRLFREDGQIHLQLLPTPDQGMGESPVDLGWIDPATLHSWLSHLQVDIPPFILPLTPQAEFVVPDHRVQHDLTTAIQAIVDEVYEERAVMAGVDRLVVDWARSILQTLHHAARRDSFALNRAEGMTLTKTDEPGGMYTLQGVHISPSRVTAAWNDIFLYVGASPPPETANAFRLA